MGTIALWVLALALGGLVFAKHGEADGFQAVKAAASRAFRVLPRIAVAVLTAGFAARLIPSGLVAQHIGPESGFYGVLIAMLVGGLIPSGPIVSFPLVVVLSQAGAGMVQLITLLTAWSVFALHRVVIYEIPLMGLPFSVTRLLSSLPLPLIAAGITSLLLSAVNR
jgi:uncharacterized membrane protein YraQ (UPF0718 family)